VFVFSYFSCLTIAGSVQLETLKFVSPLQLSFMFSHTTLNYTNIKNSLLFLMNIHLIRNKVKKTTPSSGIYIRHKSILDSCCHKLCLFVRWLRNLLRFTFWPWYASLRNICTRVLLAVTYTDMGRTSVICRRDASSTSRLTARTRKMPPNSSSSRRQTSAQPRCCYHAASRLAPLLQIIRCDFF
jgi:hypothetical protein